MKISRVRQLNSLHLCLFSFLFAFLHGNHFLSQHLKSIFCGNVQPIASRHVNISPSTAKRCKNDCDLHVSIS